MSEQSNNIPEEYTYEEAVKELEEIISQLKSPEVSLDDMREKVHRAKLLVQFCRKRLRALDEEAEEIREELSND